MAIDYLKNLCRTDAGGLILIFKTKCVWLIFYPKKITEDASEAGFLSFLLELKRLFSGHS